MGGQSGMKGYLLQSFIVVIDSLEEEGWSKIQVEPSGYDKVDILWTYNDKTTKATQVKHSKNQITRSDVTSWVTELKSSFSTATKYEIRLLGPSNKDATNLSIPFTTIHTPEIINEKALINQASNILDKFLDANTIVNLPSFAREVLIRDLITEFSILSTKGANITNADYRKQLKEKILLFLPKAITEATEELKLKFESYSRVEEKKFSLKYEACLEALNIVDEFYKLSNRDNFFSILDKINKEQKKDFKHELLELCNPIELGEKVRKCHTKLVLTCDFKETIQAFRVCLLLEKNAEGHNNQGDIVKLREEIRRELGFGETITDTNTEKAWIGLI